MLTSVRGKPCWSRLRRDARTARTRQGRRARGQVKHPQASSAQLTPPIARQVASPNRQVAELLAAEDAEKANTTVVTIDEAHLQ
jgi:hypothetical protein